MDNCIICSDVLFRPSSECYTMIEGNSGIFKPICDACYFKVEDIHSGLSSCIRGLHSVKSTLYTNLPCPVLNLYITTNTCVGQVETFVQMGFSTFIQGFTSNIVESTKHIVIINIDSEVNKKEKQYG